MRTVRVVGGVPGVVEAAFCVTDSGRFDPAAAQFLEYYLDTRSANQVKTLPGFFWMVWRRSVPWLSRGGGEPTLHAWF